MPVVGSTQKVYMGIDPGASGGIAVLIGRDAICKAMPETERDVWEWLGGYGVSAQCDACAVIEKVSGYIGKQQPGSAMFKFGYSAGMLQAFLIAADIPYEAVTPQAWQKALGIPKKGKDESKGQWKNRLKSFAQKLHPKVKVTLAVADALLIATYCQRKAEGRL